MWTYFVCQILWNSLFWSICRVLLAFCVSPSLLQSHKGPCLWSHPLVNEYISWVHCACLCFGSSFYMILSVDAASARSILLFFMIFSASYFLSDSFFVSLQDQSLLNLFNLHHLFCLFVLDYLFEQLTQPDLSEQYAADLLWFALFFSLIEFSSLIFHVIETQTQVLVCFPSLDKQTTRKKSKRLHSVLWVVYCLIRAVCAWRGTIQLMHIQSTESLFFKGWILFCFMLLGSCVFVGVQILCLE